ncbi:ABC exporter membrane fusion protein [Pantanalinema rosaneae CENA516]|uniref:ABC exporter membrane fusion protein n=1 Tax=Pantanalinema rosaneae TaxID=1620701 RepID=UPI003D6F2A00
MGEKNLLKFSGKWIAALIVLALGVTGFSIFVALRPPEQKQAQSEGSTDSTPMPPSTREDQITALGRLEPGGEVFCVSPPSSAGFSSVIRRWMVKEGDRVKQNQVIAVMDTYDRLYAAGLEAEARVREAQTRLAQVQAGEAKQGDVNAQQATIQARQAQIGVKEAEINRWAAELEIAKRDYQRYESLYNSGAISQSDLDQRRLALATASETLKQAQKELEQSVREFQQSQQVRSGLVEVRPVDLQQAEAQVQVELANLQRAKADMETAAVRSPIEGQVLKIYAKEGEQAGSAQSSGGSNRQSCSGIAELGRTDQMYAVAEVAEGDVGRVRVGQQATIASTSPVNPPFPGTLAGTVEHIGLQIRKNDVLNTDPVQDTDTRVVEVKVRLNDSQPVAKLTNLKVLVSIEP